MWVTKLLISPVKNRIFCPKTAKFGPKYAFLVILGQILPFFAHFVQCLTKKQQTRCLGAQVVTKLLISPVKKRIFCPKTTKFGPNLAFPFIAGSFGALLVGWLVVVARAVSRKTPIYFILLIFGTMFFFSVNSIRGEKLSCGSGVVFLLSFYIFIELHNG